jgi:hypothetical protein
MAVRAMAWRSCAVPVGKPRREAPWIVPVAALLVAALPIWFGLDMTLPRPLGRELEILVVSQQPKRAAPIAETRPAALVSLPIVADTGLSFGPPLPPPAVEKPRARPSVAVVGVGLQGLTMRSEPGGGERIRLVDEGTDLRDLGGSEQEVNGRWWKHVAHPDGAVGWVASEFLVPWDGVDREARTVALLKRTAGVEPSAAQDQTWTQAPPELRSITPDQLKDGRTLSSWEGYAACGPAAAVAFARAIGHDLTLDQSVAAARQVGWTPWAGIPGPRAELALLASLGIPAHQSGESEDTIDWARVIGDVQAGVPVMVVTSGHYYVAEGYDPSTGKLDFGSSAMVLAAAGHKRWFAPDELAWLGYGTPFTTIHLGPGPQPTEYIRATNIAY